VYLISVHLIGVHLTGLHLTGVHFMGVYLMGVYHRIVPIARRKGTACLRIDMRYMGILIFENSFVVLKVFSIFDFGTGPYGPNLPP
jgi:hypothetical protein